MENEYGDFDVTSEGPRQQPSSDEQQAWTNRNKRKAIRILFSCCNVYANLPIPYRVDYGELTSWRFHCPRCGGLIEIPL